jgi:uncharacterized protein
MKKTVIIGATTNPSRYAFTAAQMLTQKNIEFVPLGIKKGEIFGKEILDLNTKPKIENVDTVTLYLGSQNQKEWLDYIVSLKPKRIIFNPGTENPELYQLAKSNGIQYLNACTLVMLSTGQF